MLKLRHLGTVLGTSVEAGTDTTAISLLWFIMAMVTYPECMKRAQYEIDTVLGTDGQTLPSFAHMDALPYCFALTKEVFRYVLPQSNIYGYYWWLILRKPQLEACHTFRLPPLL